ncbi:MAG TPA: hypothetical protein VK686_18310, partial [Bryobacteraceae bacterium]|nr:hypothetical protein [Bryobacteraceae bacterium]
ATIKASEASPLVIYDFRQTGITRWAKVLPLPVVQGLAGHTEIVTTKRYVHLNDDDVHVQWRRSKRKKKGTLSGIPSKARHLPPPIDPSKPLIMKWMYFGAGGGA